MPLKLLSEQSGEIYLSAISPTSLWEYKLPDTLCLVASGPYGQFLLQEMTGTGYSLWYNTYQAQQQDTILLSGFPDQLRIPFMLRCGFPYSAGGLEDWNFYERSYHIYYTPDPLTRLRVEKDIVYSTVELFLPRERLEPLAAYYPALATLLRRMAAGEAATLGPGPLVASPPMVAILNSILSNRYTGPLRQWYLDLKVGELLLLAIQRATHVEPPPPVKLSAEEVSNIYEVRSLLLKQLDRSFSIDLLARKKGLTAHKLKRGFQKIYGTGIFDFLLEARMERAGALLLETHIPVEQVARLTGYHNLANFSVVFKKFYGYSPRYFRGK
ncbi:MAG: AraC family transcriptional regulator [Candidatus Pseudobacter hemicellulosilyticus]|uniref:AraC family transcriptional regulator n=1 Tax=Candidatus Pseudobacter hemicellulosilyticus TaxID=3121375 RepID=A0AAJ5WXS6_9BACT|nr:MAG: AraC family transcriptional regulator [Pseudobacter sp.]